MTISSQQIKAARAWLGWTQEFLAEEAGVSPGTIRNIEEGKLSLRSIQPIRLVFENQGFKFHGRNGLTHQPAETKTFDGPESRDEFFEELLSSVQRKGGDVKAMFQSQQQLTAALGDETGQFRRLEQLAKYATIKCLVSDTRHLPTVTPNTQFKASRSDYFGPSLAQIIHDNVSAIIMGNSRKFFFYVMKDIETSNSVSRDFDTRWAAALPLLNTPRSSK